MATTLMAKLGDCEPHKTSVLQLAVLSKGNICKEVAQQAEHPACLALAGAPNDIIDHQALEAFLWSLPTALCREVLQVEKHTAKSLS